MAPSNAFWEARIEAVQAQIIAYEAAITALSSGAQSYQLDTGQTRQIVNRAQLATLKNVLDGLYNQLTTLCARVYGSQVLYYRPGF